MEGFFNILVKDGWRFTKIKQERNRSQVFIELINPNINMLDENDVVNPRIVLANSVDLRVSFNAAFGAYRVLCSNGLVIPDTRCKELNIMMKGRHYGNCETHFKHFQAEVLNRMDVIKEFGTTYRSLMNQPVSEVRAIELLRGFVGKRKLDYVLELWDNAPGQDGRHNKWTLYNAMTYWLSHDATGGTYQLNMINRKFIKRLLESN
jgi:hypothetical protein